MNKNTIVAVVVLILLVVVGFLAFNQSSVEAPEVNLEDDQPLEEPIQKEEAEETASGPEVVVEEFLANFIKSAPPEPDQAAREVAMALISPEAVEKTLDGEGEFSLPLFVGVQDIPDVGHELVSVEYQNDPVTGQADSLAEATVNLKYSGGDSLRVFPLALIDGQWLIIGPARMAE